MALQTTLNPHCHREKDQPRVTPRTSSIEVKSSSIWLLNELWADQSIEALSASHTHRHRLYQRRHRKLLLSPPCKYISRLLKASILISEREQGEGSWPSIGSPIFCLPLFARKLRKIKHGHWPCMHCSVYILEVTRSNSGTNKLKFSSSPKCYYWRGLEIGRTGGGWDLEGCQEDPEMLRYLFQSTCRRILSDWCTGSHLCLIASHLLSLTPVQVCETDWLSLSGFTTCQIMWGIPVILMHLVDLTGWRNLQI